MTSHSPNFNGASVLTFAGRRSEEMRRLIERNGGKALLAPAIREVPLQEPPEFDALLEALKGTIPVWLILLTGSGAKVLLERLESHLGRESLLKVLSRINIITRGPKPSHTLRQWGWKDFLTVPEPNTWRELLGVLDAAELPLNDNLAIVQEFGAPHTELVSALSDRGAKVLSVPVYRWAMPDDLEPIKAAIAELINGKIDVTLWTAASQIHHVFAIAETMQCSDRLHDALTKTLIGSIGPITSVALHEYGLTPTLEPQHPKMGHLIKDCAAKFHLR